MNEHTPGPWAIEELLSCDTEPGDGAETLVTAYADENGKEGATVAKVNRWTYGDDPPTKDSMENARLIAAAPDLYEACKHAFEFHEWLAKRIRTLPEDVQQDIGEVGGEAATVAIMALEKAEANS